jgi:GntR family transcriptional regulator
VNVLRTVERLSAQAADPRLAGLLEQRRGAPLLRVERTALTYRDAPVEFRVRWVRTTDHRYLAVLGRR